MTAGLVACILDKSHKLEKRDIHRLTGPFEDGVTADDNQKLANYHHSQHTQMSKEKEDLEHVAEAQRKALQTTQNAPKSIIPGVAQSQQKRVEDNQNDLAKTMESIRRTQNLIQHHEAGLLAHSKAATAKKAGRGPLGREDVEHAVLNWDEALNHIEMNVDPMNSMETRVIQTARAKADEGRVHADRRVDAEHRKNQVTPKDHH
ncbi:hypothetical protein FRC17_002699 [Serendipita sp. 399]|nr:hypothetical protein FRC17_002699 [Serendipita sp. 399]